MCAFRADLVLPAGAVFAVVSRLRDHERVESSETLPAYISRAFVRTRRPLSTWVDWHPKLGGRPTVEVFADKVRIFAPQGMMLESRDLEILAATASIRRDNIGWAGTPFRKRSCIRISGRTRVRPIEVALSAPADLNELWRELLAAGFRES